MVTAMPFAPILWLYSFVFLAGYPLIIVEHVVRLDKAAIALLMACVAWTVFFCSNNVPLGEDLVLFSHQVSDVSQIVFFLLGALAIVETINAHNGFAALINVLRIDNTRTLLWAISFITFFLSSVLDNLTTTIVMVSLLRYLLPPGQLRMLFGGAIVISANAGGAWTPLATSPLPCYGSAVR